MRWVNTSHQPILESSLTWRARDKVYCVFGPSSCPSQQVLSQYFGGVRILFGCPRCPSVQKFVENNSNRPNITFPCVRETFHGFVRSVMPIFLYLQDFKTFDFGAFLQHTKIANLKMVSVDGDIIWVKFPSYTNDGGFLLSNVVIVWVEIASLNWIMSSIISSSLRMSSSRVLFTQYRS